MLIDHHQAITAAFCIVNRKLSLVARKYGLTGNGLFHPRYSRKPGFAHLRQRV
jgi:hypothetical protein